MFVGATTRPADKPPTVTPEEPEVCSDLGSLNGINFLIGDA